jgi:hypothetical protein
VSPATEAERFRERALAEARRYGSDPWVVVRELLQNARDAGATTVAFRTETEGGRTRLSCRDDGHGLTFDEAQRDLFTLYASRKHGRDAGRFGVGFWSVLLTDPERIVVRSWPRRGEPWEVAWDGTLTRARRGQPPSGPIGVEVVIESAGADSISAPVFAAAWRHARFLRRRDGRGPLAIRVDGRSANAELALPSPSMAFRRRGLRGVVALGAEPRVELFGKGLLVRASASLDELTAPGARGPGAVPATGLPGLSAQFLLDSDDLDLLLSRGDARSDAALARVVAVAREELDRLLDRQLARSGRRPFRLTGRWAAALLTAVTAGVGLGAMLAPRPLSSVATAAVGSREAAAAPVADASGSAATATPRPYRDPRPRYAQPILDPLDHEPRELALRYEPPSAALHLTVLRIDSFDGDGRPRVSREPIGPYEGATCAAECVAFELLAIGSSWTSLPVPTGHRLDPASLRVAGQPSRVWATSSDEPMVRLAGDPVAVRYRTGPVADPRRADPPPAAMPDVLEPGVRAIRGMPPFERPAAASRWVRSRVRESRARDVAARFASEARSGRDFARTAIELGAGDCDVQNGIVTRLLQATGVPARLAVGYLGVDGAAIPGLHAWVEHRAAGGEWLVEDASRNVSDFAAPPATAVAGPAPDRAFPARSPADPRPLRIVGAAGALALAGGGLLALARRPKRSFRLAASADVAGLVRGALRHPEAVTRVPALLERALIPRLGGGRATLADAQERAEGVGLFVARRESALTRRAAREGGLVLDGARTEARAVAEALGAVDLDEWSARLEGAARSDAVARVNRHLARARVRFRLHATAEEGPPRVLDLPRSREIVVSAKSDWLAAAEASATSRPAAAALAVAERVADLLAMPDDQQAALLGPLADEALLEDAR